MLHLIWSFLLSVDIYCMKICRNCREERSYDEYYTYWHSTQQKYRTRNICNVCTRENNREYNRSIKNKKVIVEVIQTQICPCCKKDIPITGYYDCNKNIKGRYCITCIKKNQNIRNYDKAMSEGGSVRVSQKPNTYADQYQKAQTFMVLETLGWTFNEDTSIWSRDGVKDKFGTWLNIIPQPRTNNRPTGIIVKKKHGVYNYINQIIQQREEGMTYPDLAYIYCCSHTTIRNIVTKYYSEKKT